MNKFFIISMLAMNFQAVAAPLSPLPTKLLSGLDANHAKVQQQLQHATPEEADQLFKQQALLEENTLNRLNKADEEFINNEYTSLIKLDKKTGKIQSKSPQLIAREKALAKHHLRYMYYPFTGVVEMLFAPSYYQMFLNKTSHDVRDYIQLRLEDAQYPVFEESLLVQPFAKIGERVIAWERYLNHHPNSPYLAQAKCIFLSYQSIFLTGVDDNLGLMGILDPKHFSYATPPNKEKLSPEVKRAWADYQQKYPKSAASILIGRMPTKPPFQGSAMEVVSKYEHHIGALSDAQCNKMIQF